MSPTPIISIIVPCYNTSKYLDQCIESLVKQTLHEIEIICINDASPDDSLKKLRVWASRDNRIKIIDSPINRNLGGSRNLGIKAATANYVGFVDSDDFVSPDFYQLLIKNSKDLSADIVMANKYCDCSELGELQQERFNIAKLTDNLAELKRQILLYGCRLVTSIFQKSLFYDNNLFFPENCHYEDNAVVPCLYMSARTISIVENEHPTYFYRQNPQSITRCKNNNRLFDRIKNSNLFLENTKRLGVYDYYPLEVDIRYYDLIYRITLIQIFRTFTRLPVGQTRHVIRHYGEDEKIKSNPYFNPYYRGTSREIDIGISIVKLSAKIPFAYVPLRCLFNFAQSIKRALIG